MTRRTKRRAATPTAAPQHGGGRDHASISESLSECLAETKARIGVVEQAVKEVNNELGELYVTKESLEHALHLDVPQAVGVATRRNG